MHVKYFHDLVTNVTPKYDKKQRWVDYLPVVCRTLSNKKRPIWRFSVICDGPTFWWRKVSDGKVGNMTQKHAAVGYVETQTSSKMAPIGSSNNNITVTIVEPVMRWRRDERQKTQKPITLHTYQERMNLRGLEQTFYVHRQSVSRWIVEHGKGLTKLKDALLPAEADEILEYDEAWSFVLKKLNKPQSPQVSTWGDCGYIGWTCPIAV